MALALLVASSRAQTFSSLRSYSTILKSPSRFCTPHVSPSVRSAKSLSSSSNCGWSSLKLWTQKDSLITLCTRCYSTLTRSTVLCRNQIGHRQLPMQLLSNCGHRHRNLNLSHIRKSNTKSTNANSQGKKPAPNISEIKRILLLAKPEKWKLAGAVVLLLVSSSVTMAVPFGIGRVIDIIYSKEQEGQMIDRLAKFCKILMCIFIVGAVANFGRVYLMSTSGNRIIKRMREMVFSSIVRQEIAFFDKNKTGELINRLSTDTSIVGATVTNNISDGLRSVTQAVGGITMMVYMSPKLAAVAMCIVPPVFVVSRVYGRYVKKITNKVQDSLASSTQVAEERLSNMRTVRAFVQENKELAAYNSKITDVLHLSYKEALAKALFWSFTGLSGNIMIISVFYYGGLLMSDSMITVGELSSFMMYAAFSGVSIGGLTSFYSEMMRGVGASKRLWELVDTQSSIPLSEGLSPVKALQGHIEFRDVGFSYPTRPDVEIFKRLSLSIPTGGVLAVVGPSGSGKSTVASLLMRFYDPQGGAVCVDGMDIRQLNPQWLRSHIGVVSQEPALFSSSIAENIAYGAQEPSQVTAEQIVSAAKMANAYQFVSAFPSGFETLVGERGVMLSGGQKQRIAIARAILKNPKILLLDEATSALDAESEFLVQEALERVSKGRTVVVIAHRLSTIRSASQIAVLSEGQVQEMGSYEQLINIPDGMFRKLVERQTIET